MNQLSGCAIAEYSLQPILFSFSQKKAKSLRLKRFVTLTTKRDNLIRGLFKLNKLFLKMTKHLGVCYTCAEAVDSKESLAFLVSV